MLGQQRQRGAHRRAGYVEQVSQELLAEIIPILAKKLDAWSTQTGTFDYADYSAWSARRSAADDKIVEFFTTRYDAVFTQPSGAYSVRMAGIRSTSTMGWTGALNNWKRAAETKLATKAGPQLTRDRFTAARLQIGPFDAVNMSLGAFGPAKPDLSDLIRTERWTSDCKCWSAVDGFHRPGG